MSEKEKRKRFQTPELFQAELERLHSIAQKKSRTGERLTDGELKTLEAIQDSLKQMNTFQKIFMKVFKKDEKILSDKEKTSIYNSPEAFFLPFSGALIELLHLVIKATPLYRNRYEEVSLKLDFLAEKRAQDTLQKSELVIDDTEELIYPSNDEIHTKLGDYKK